MNMIRRIILVLIMIAGLTGNAFAQLTKDQALSQFIAGGMAYKEERYDEAIERYTSVINNNLESGPLYYNLANSYFKKNNLGKAVLNYERAKRFIPRDSDVKFNSAYAEGQVGSSLEEKGGVLEKAFRNHAKFYTYNEMTLMIFGLFVVLGLFHIITVYGWWRPNYSSVIYAVIALMILVFVSGVFVKYQSENNMAVALTDSNTYFEPRTDSTVHFKLSEGMKARVIKSQGPWLKIERLDGKQGWVNREALEKI